MPCCNDSVIQLLSLCNWISFMLRTIQVHVATGKTFDPSLENCVHLSWQKSTFQNLISFSTPIKMIYQRILGDLCHTCEDFLVGHGKSIWFMLFHDTREICHILNLVVFCLVKLFHLFQPSPVVLVNLLWKRMVRDKINRESIWWNLDLDSMKGKIELTASTTS